MSILHTVRAVRAVPTALPHCTPAKRLTYTFTQPMFLRPINVKQFLCISIPHLPPCPSVSTPVHTYPHLSLKFHSHSSSKKTTQKALEKSSNRLPSPADQRGTIISDFGRTDQKGRANRSQPERDTDPDKITSISIRAPNPTWHHQVLPAQLTSSFTPDAVSPIAR